MDIRFKFICKVALSGGYFLFGNKFIKYADHDSLRKAMLAENLENENLNLRFYDNLHPIKDENKLDIDMIKFLFKYLNGTVVIFSYSPYSIIAHVGIGGDFVGTINFKADIKHFPNNDEFRLGRVLLCRGGKLIQKSFWKTIYDMNKNLKIVDIDDSELDV